LRRAEGIRTVFLVDETHRWSKSQQDSLLPYVEDGSILLLGATTENPVFDLIAPYVLDSLVAYASGDARLALTALDAPVEAAQDLEPPVVVGPNKIATALSRRHGRYDRDGDDQHDPISAFIESVRGSDPDAALFWLAKKSRAGEDLRFIARRLIILASEDIGNADLCVTHRDRVGRCT
jgi:putative ATPase